MLPAKALPALCRPALVSAPGLRAAFVFGSALLRSVLRDGVRIYERNAGLAAEFLSRARTTVVLDGPGYDQMMRAFMKRVAERGVGS